MGLLAGGALVWLRPGLRAEIVNLAELRDQPSYLFTGLKTEEQFLDYLQSHRSDVALVSFSADETEARATNDPVIRHNAEKSMPLASTMKILVLAAYAREVVAGRLFADEEIPLERWDRYYLKGTDGGAHLEALSELGLFESPGDLPNSSSAANPTVNLGRIARAMIRYSDNAATDYLLDRLGEAALKATIEEAALTDQQPIRSLLGEFLSFANHDHPLLTGERLDELLILSANEYKERTEELARLHLETPWGEFERESRRTGFLQPILKNERQAAHTLTPKGTAREYARIMSEVIGGRFISTEVSALMRRYLEWPMEVGDNQEKFFNFGAKGGTLLSILTEAMYLTPQSGDFAGQTRVIILFMRQIPVSAWLRMQITFIHQQFMVRLATEREFAEEVTRKLG